MVTLSVYHNILQLNLFLGSASEAVNVDTSLPIQAYDFYSRQGGFHFYGWEACPALVTPGGNTLSNSGLMEGGAGRERERERVSKGGENDSPVAFTERRLVSSRPCVSIPLPGKGGEPRQRMLWERECKFWDR